MAQLAVVVAVVNLSLMLLLAGPLLLLPTATVVLVLLYTNPLQGNVAPHVVVVNRVFEACLSASALAARSPHSDIESTLQVAECNTVLVSKLGSCRELVR